MAKQEVRRLDARAKVTGHAVYAADNNLKGMLYGYPVSSTIARGKLVTLKMDAASAAPGVVCVFHAGNFPKLYRTEQDDSSYIEETRPPLSDSNIYYAGQYIALVVAESFEQARSAARLVTAEYEPSESIAITMKQGLSAVKHLSTGKRGDPLGAFASAAVQHDAVYSTPNETHSPMELHANVAVWDGDRLSIHSASQGVVNEQNVLAQMLGISLDQITVLSPYIGGGFGGKLYPWPQTFLAVVAARELKRPVKVTVPRTLMFTSVGHRPETQQRIRLGATHEGKLVAVQHDAINQTGVLDDYQEDCSDTTKALYSCANLGVTESVAPVNVAPPTAMRAPGSAPGLFAIESAMDELAIKLKMDPVELRRKNYPESCEDTKKPWSSNHTLECYEVAANKFGWEKRDPQPGSMRDGNEILGWGVASCSWPAPRVGASARVELLANGRVRVASATQDIGTGTITVMALATSQMTGAPLDKIDVKVGDTTLPSGPMSGGSQVTASIIPAIAAATKAAFERVKIAAVKPDGVFPGIDPASIQVSGCVLADPKSGKKATFAEILSGRGLSGVDGEASTGLGENAEKYEFRSYGVHFAEVRWDPAITRLRVSRVVSALDAGRIINPTAARNQVQGAIVMGVGMALMEHTIYDHRTGRPVNDNLADYLLPVHADAPQVDVTFLDYPDPYLNELGARGLGEIGLTGLAASVANAVYHATGKRVRDLPITIEKLMA